MVEAIVIMTTMLVFLGMNVWAAQAYGGKIDQANSTRRDALYFASHSCESSLGQDPDSYTVPALRGNASSGGGSSLSLMGLINMARGGGSFDVFSTARSSKGPVAVGGTAVVNLQRVPLSAQLRTASAVGCNEKPHYNKYLALFEMGLGFLTGLVTG